MDDFETIEKKSYDHLIEGYKILNSIKPFYFQTKYPFNNLSVQKVIFTENKIDILAKDYEKFINNKKSKDESKYSQKIDKTIFLSNIRKKKTTFKDVANEVDNESVDIGSDVRTDESDIPNTDISSSNIRGEIKKGGRGKKINSIIFYE
jgi:hypothetical protein